MIGVLIIATFIIFRLAINGCFRTLKHKRAPP